MGKMLGGSSTFSARAAGSSAKTIMDMRVKITSAIVIIIAVVVAMILVIITVLEYNSKIDYVSDQLQSSITKVVSVDEQRKTASSNGGYHDDANSKYDIGGMDDNTVNGDGEYDEQDETSGNVPMLGIGSTFDINEYIPIIIYRVDGDTGTLSSIGSQSASLTDESFKYADDGRMLSAPYGFSRSDMSTLCFYKEATVLGDVVAITDASSVDTYMGNIEHTFTVMFVVIVLSITVLVWFLTKKVTRPVEDAMGKQRQFIADASHELKTPLSVIMANSSLILDEDKSIDDIRSLTKTTLDESERMRKLIADMLYMAMNDEGRSGEKSSFDIGHEVTKDAMQFEARAYERGNTISYDDVPSGCSFYGDRGGIRRIMEILLDNACKYANRGTSIDVKLHYDKKRIIITVSDIGEQIQDSERELIFDRFYRTDKARTGYNGYGLGLPMAKSIVSNHGGTISALSDAGKTVFTVTLPREE